MPKVSKRQVKILKTLIIGKVLQIMKTSNSQLKASMNWKKKHPVKQRNYQYGSYARKFVRDIANREQLLQLQKMINDRLSQLR